MHINATERINRMLGEIDAKIKQLESSPNRAFDLVDYETISSFHWFNIFFKIFCDEFDRHSASQLMLCLDFLNRYSKLCERYEFLIREHIDYLESLVDFEQMEAQNLPPVFFSEDNSTEIIGYYKECCKDYVDNKGKPLYTINLDRDTHSEVIDGKNVPIDLYIFSSDKSDEDYYRSLEGIYHLLKNIHHLMCVVCSYPDYLISGYKPNQEEIIIAIENGLRQYAKEIGKRVESDLKRTAQYLKPYRNASLDSHIWGLVMQAEDELFEIAKSGKFCENDEKHLESISASKEQLIDNYNLLDKIKINCVDEELFDIRYSVENHRLLQWLNADNLDLFYELVLRRNIIHREMFPKKLRAKYEEWLNQPENEQQQEDDEGVGLSDVRQSKLNEIIGILQRGKWKLPATADNIELLLNTVFGKDTSLFEEGDIDKCEKMWALVEGGKGKDRKVIVSAKLAGFIGRVENLMNNDGPKSISDDLFGKNNNQVNAINKGKLGCSNDFDVVIPFLKKYIDKIIRQI